VGKLLFISLLLVSFIILNVQFVAAETVLNNLLNNIPSVDIDSGFLDEGLSFDENPGIIRILIFVLVTLIIYSISNFLPFVPEKNPWIAWGISIIIAILSTFFLAKEEIYTLLLSYNALGITLTALIPFIAIAAVSKKLYDEGGLNMLFSKILWVAFLGFLIFRWMLADPRQIGDFGTYVYPIIFILSFIMVIWDKWVYRWIFKRETSSAVEDVKKAHHDSIVARIAQLHDQERALMASGDTKKAERIRERIDELISGGKEW